MPGYRRNGIRASPAQNKGVRHPEVWYGAFCQAISPLVSSPSAWSQCAAHDENRGKAWYSFIVIPIVIIVSLCSVKDIRWLDSEYFYCNELGGKPVNLCASGYWTFYKNLKQ